MDLSVNDRTVSGKGQNRYVSSHRPYHLWYTYANEVTMRIVDIIWLPEVVDKLAWKHAVEPEEVDQILFGKPFYRKVQKGHIPGEDVYTAMGQTETGRYLIVFFVYKESREALVLSARDMDRSERRQYGRK